MTSAVPGFSTPGAGPEAPLEMLVVCHDRVARQCATLRRLVSHMAAHGANAQARDAALSVMRYFDSSAIDHHQDEEVNLFPALIDSMAGSDAVCLHRLIDDLTREHRTLETLWQRLRITLVSIAAGESVLLKGEEVEELVVLYERHIRCEETELLPMATRLLSEAALTEMGRAMRLRRGIGDISL